jgi:hypothetical protein
VLVNGAVECLCKRPLQQLTGPNYCDSDRRILRYESRPGFEVLLCRQFALGQRLLSGAEAVIPMTCVAAVVASLARTPGQAIPVGFGRVNSRWVGRTGLDAS